MIKNLVLGSGVSFVTSFITLVLTARLFPLEFVSDVKAVTLYGGWIATVFTFQVHSAFLYFYDSNNITTHQLKFFTYSLVTLLAILASSFFYFILPIVYDSNTLSIKGLIFFSYSVGLNLLFITSPSIYSANKITNKLPVFMFSYSLGTLFSVLITYAFNLSINNFAVVQATFLTLVFLSSDWRTIFKLFAKNFSLKAGFSQTSYLVYSKRVTISIFFESIGEKIDKFASSKLMTQLAFAKYSVLCFENPMVNILLNSYGVGFVKKYQAGIANQKTTFIKEWREAISVVSFITFPVSFFILFNAEWFVSFLFGTRYLDSAIVIMFYSVVSLIRYGPFQALLRMENLVNYNIFMSIGFLCTAIAVSLIVIGSSIQLEYLAIAYLCGWLMFNCMAIYFFSTRVGISFLSILCPKLWLSRLVQGGLAGAIPHMLTDNIYITVLLFCLTYGFLVLSMDCHIRKIIILILQTKRFKK